MFVTRHGRPPFHPRYAMPAAPLAHSHSCSHIHIGPCRLQALCDLEPSFEHQLAEQRLAISNGKRLTHSTFVQLLAALLATARRAARTFQARALLALTARDATETLDTAPAVPIPGASKALQQLHEVFEYAQARVEGRPPPLFRLRRLDGALATALADAGTLTAVPLSAVSRVVPTPGVPAPSGSAASALLQFDKHKLLMACPGVVTLELGAACLRCGVTNWRWLLWCGHTSFSCTHSCPKTGCKGSCLCRLGHRPPMGLQPRLMFVSWRTWWRRTMLGLWCNGPPTRCRWHQLATYRRQHWPGLPPVMSQLEVALASSLRHSMVEPMPSLSQWPAPAEYTWWCCRQCLNPALPHPSRRHRHPPRRGRGTTMWR